MNHLEKNAYYLLFAAASKYVAGAPQSSSDINAEMSELFLW